MRVLDRVSWVTVLGVVLALGASACGTASPDGYPGTGIVREVDPGAREVTLDHEDIAGLMKGMTMTFKVAPDVELEGIARGAKVDFRVREEGGVYTLTELRPSGS